MAKTITSANAVYTLAVSDLSIGPSQLQGFSADDIFTTEPLASAETLMGVDGNLSGGFVFVPVLQNINLQADSSSNDLFDQWWLAQQIAKDLFYANGVVILTSIGKKWTLTKGVLHTFPPIPDAAKTLRPRRFGLTWETVSPASI